MRTTHSRRWVLARTVLGMPLVALSPPSLLAAGRGGQTPQSPPAPAIAPKRSDPLAPDLVKTFVGKAHSDLAATQSLLEEHPSLLNATWDWGGGDFEMGIGGAGHMGNREIAEFLIGRGGRADIFVLAMLGRLEVVKALLEAYPGLITARGPHGITLVRHAEKGGAPAEATLDYLRRLGAA